MLEVKNLKYSYNSDYQALKGVSLKIEKGEMVALLGKNGAGKSTLFLHLNGIYEPDEGQVFIDGQEITARDADVNRIRRSMGMVFQDFRLFDLPLRDNVTAGREVDDADVEAFKKLNEKGIELEIRKVDTDKKTNLMDVLNKQ